MKLSYVVAAVLLLAAAAKAGAFEITPAMVKTFTELDLAYPARVDISHTYVLGMPTFHAPRGLQPFFHPVLSLTTKAVGIRVHGLSRSDQTLWNKGYDVDFVDLETLTGLCLVVEIPWDQNITAEVMKQLAIPRGVERVLFKTLNTDRGLMYQQAFDSSYTAFTTDGAQYLVANTDIKLVGIDFMSVGVGVEEELIGVHLTFLKAKGIIPVEGVKLDDVVPGYYTITCLQLRFARLNGCPARCILELTTMGGPTPPSKGGPSLLSFIFIGLFVLFLKKFTP